VSRCFGGNALVVFDVSRCVIRQVAGAFLCDALVVLRPLLQFAVVASFKEKFMPN